MKKSTPIKPFSLLIKPASADCNLRCAYCFYTEKAELYPGSAVHRMSDPVLEKLISSYMGTDQPQYAFAWQGGEPALMGVDFYRRVTELQSRYGFAGASVANHLQTNAVLMTDELAEHLAGYNFLVGVSLDGPAEIHDHFRTFQNGEGSHAQVMRGLGVLRRHNVETNILTLVTSVNAGKGREVYDYLVGQGIFYHQYIPCVEFDGRSRLMPYALSPEAWGEFLCTIFDHWIADTSRQVSVRYFDALLQYLVTGERIICHMTRNCNLYFMVEHNGDVYPCDFFAQRDLLLGNVCNDSWPKLLDSRRYKKFGIDKSNWHTDCDRCPYLQLCAGDCLKHRLNHGTQTPQQKSWLCAGYKMFFSHALQRLQNMATEIRNRNNFTDASTSRFIQPVKISRNQSCPCGSGLKYKKCCGNH
ncbi:anaerobic sulfatase maturase [bacterium]|nr:anaerobic sulfatase maturase [bacterium]